MEFADRSSQRTGDALVRACPFTAEVVLMKKLLIGAAVGIILGATAMYLAMPTSAASPTTLERAKMQEDADAAMKDFNKHDTYKQTYDKLP